MIFLMYRQQSEQESNQHSLQLINIWPEAFKQSQGHQTYNENVDPKQGYNHAKFERYTFTVCE